MDDQVANVCDGSLRMDQPRCGRYSCLVSSLFASPVRRTVLSDSLRGTYRTMAQMPSNNRRRRIVAVGCRPIKPSVVFWVETIPHRLFTLVLPISFTNSRIHTRSLSLTHSHTRIPAFRRRPGYPIQCRQVH